MMRRSDLKKLNVVPEGKPPWLSYEQYMKLGQLFDMVIAPDQDRVDTNDVTLHTFLTTIAGLTLPLASDAIHYNAFVLLRRGYKVEEITGVEYADLIRLLAGLEQPDKTDMDLYDTGGHRDLYNYLTRQMGLMVEAGRGPVWYRAQALIQAHQDTLESATT